MTWRHRFLMGHFACILHIHNTSVMWTRTALWRLLKNVALDKWMLLSLTIFCVGLFLWERAPDGQVYLINSKSCMHKDKQTPHTTQPNVPVFLLREVLRMLVFISYHMFSAMLISQICISFDSKGVCLQRKRLKHWFTLGFMSKSQNTNICGISKYQILFNLAIHHIFHCSYCEPQLHDSMR